MKPTYLWKSLAKGHESGYGNFHWTLNKWYKHKGELSMCNSGFHASRLIADAMHCVDCDSLALVEVRGEHLKQDDKECWSEMRVVKFYKWTRLLSVMLAVFVARQVLDIFEKQYPNDDRPRKALEAAEAYIKYPTKKNVSAAANAANAVPAANAAYAAAYAVYAVPAANAANAVYAVHFAYTAANAIYAADNAVYFAYTADNAVHVVTESKQKYQKYIYKLIGYETKKD